VNNFIEIITLQHSTFNQWAWIIGTIILLIIAGVTFKEDTESSVLMIPISFVWPIFAGIAVLLSPVWIGVKLGDYLRKKHEDENTDDNT
jgi:multidrug transporter EmrE-like cation transporter